jgi:hypothetical protein
MKIQITGREKLVVRMSGKMNESSDLEMISVPNADSVEIDLIDLTLINSVGIRIFKDWIFKIKAPIITLSYCPRIFIDQVNMVVDFLPKHARITSFYVPYFNEASGEEKAVLFVRGEHFTVENGKPEIKLPVVTDSAGSEMEVDVLGDRYFQFLKKY